MKRKAVYGLVFASVLLILISAVSASSFVGSVTLDCRGWDGTGSTNTANRDNTGSGTEKYEYVGYDGAGNVIFSDVINRTVGVSSAVGQPNWMTAPKYNPLTLKLVSHAGNGLPEVISGYWQGTCAGLPTLSVEDGGLPMAGPPALNLSDGRINGVAERDVAAPVAIYCTTYDTVEVFKIDATGEGQLVVSFAQDAAPEDGVLGNEADVLVSLLTSGEYQVNAHYPDGKDYIFVWEGCGETKYHIAW